MKMIRFLFYDMEKVKGPQICSINSGFLNIDMTIAELSSSRVIYVFGFIRKPSFGIINSLSKKSAKGQNMLLFIKRGARKKGGKRAGVNSREGGGVNEVEWA